MGEHFASVLQVAFLDVFKMSCTSVLLILAVVLFRFLLKKAPKSVNCFLWLIVAARLILPFSLESPFGLAPSSNKVAVKSSEYLSSLPSFQGSAEAVFPFGSAALTNGAQASAESSFDLTFALAVVWLLGFFGLLAYGAVSYILLRKRVSLSVEEEKNVFLSDAVSSPFILGVFRPKIFLPAGLDEERKKAVLAHERAHLQRLDHVFKPLAFFVFSLHWFNPFCVLAYILLCRDIELACDERAVKRLDFEKRREYSQTLLDLSVDRKRIAACPLAFGEVGVKKRVKNVLNYKRPTFWLIVFALISAVAVAVFFGTERKNEVNFSSDVISIVGYDNPNEDISFEAVAAEKGDDGGLSLSVRFLNKSNEKNYSFGEFFEMYRYNAQSFTFEKMTAAENAAFNSVAYLVSPSTALKSSELTLSYPLSPCYDMSRQGRYRFVTSVQSSENGASPQKLSITFDLKSPPQRVSKYNLLGGSKQLTLDDIRTLSKKGSPVTVKDFEDYAYFETGSGIYIRVYPVDEDFNVMIGALSAEGIDEPLYISLTAGGASIEFGSETDEFISDYSFLKCLAKVALKNRFSNEPAVKTLDGETVGSAFEIFDFRREGEKAVLYIKYMEGAYVVYGEGKTARNDYFCTPAVLTFEKNEDKIFELQSLEVPREKSFEKDVKRLFSKEAANVLLQTPDFSQELDEECQKSAIASYYKVAYSCSFESEKIVLTLFGNGRFSLSGGSGNEISGEFRDDGKRLVLSSGDNEVFTFERDLTELKYLASDSSPIPTFSNGKESGKTLPDGSVFSLEFDVGYAKAIKSALDFSVSK